MKRITILTALILLRTTAWAVGAEEASRTPANTSETNSVLVATDGANPAVSGQDTNSTAVSAPGPSTSSASRLDLQSFRIIAERNIFNPNRSSRSRTGRGRETERRVIRTESFSLVGTMSYEKGSFAFFDGSSSQYRKVLRRDDSIAGYRITGIGPNHVKLEADGQKVELSVGMQMRKQDEEEWRLGSLGDSLASARLSPTPNEATNASAEASRSSGDESDVLKKLMEKREQELKNEKP